MSHDSKHIYSIVYANDANLKITAEMENMKKNVSIEFSDILSFEPCDEGLRPLRLSSFIWDKTLQYRNKALSHTEIQKLYKR